MLSEKENALSNRGHERRANPELIEGKKNPNPKERLGSETLDLLGFDNWAGAGRMRKP